ncbi:hypothetical protein [Pandoravirus japonicus]|uniref:Transmembrane protein n=1 Tax=Pandoravirus japonicus TaxID=2823154 RepID=A0A811BSV8_9VIRU|nr:hypothetical protein [Pandoravirus japonicus]
MRPLALAPCSLSLWASAGLVEGRLPCRPLLSFFSVPLFAPSLRAVLFSPPHPSAPTKFPFFFFFFPLVCALSFFVSLLFSSNHPHRSHRLPALPFSFPFCGLDGEKKSKWLQRAFSRSHFVSSFFFEGEGNDRAPWPLHTARARACASRIFVQPAGHFFFSCALCLRAEKPNPRKAGVREGGGQ